MAANFVKGTLVVLGTGLLLVACFPPTAPETSDEPQGPREFTWNYLDGGGASDGLDSSFGEILAVDAETLNGELYVAWADPSDGLLRVSRYDGGSSWTSIDGDGSGLNSEDSISYFSSSYFQKISLEAFDGRLYLASIAEPSSEESQIRVASYDPAVPDWTFVHGPSGYLNSSSTVAAGGPVLAATGDALYAVWQEDTPSELYAAEYGGDDSSPAWTSLGPALNYNVANTAYRPVAAANDGQLIVVWEENESGVRDDIRAKSYDPGAGGAVAERWSEIDGGSLNRVVGGTNRVGYPGAVAASDGLHVFWTEENTSGVPQLRASVYDGSSWVELDGGGEAGLNYDSEQDAGWNPIAPSVVGGQVAVAYTEESSASVLQLRALGLNGTASDPEWGFIDGNASTGLNVEPSTYDAEEPAATEFNGDLVVAWIEIDGASLNQNVRVIRGQ